MRRKGRVVLLGALGTLAVVEAVGIATDSDTISGLTADVFHTDTATGRGIFAGMWLAFSGWFLWHIVTFARSVKAEGDRRNDRTPDPEPR